MKFILRLASIALLAVGASALASAVPSVVPEIDPGTGMNALALLAGAVLIVRAGIKK
jgi:hypothetical protein